MLKEAAAGHSMFEETERWKLCQNGMNDPESHFALFSKQEKCPPTIFFDFILSANFPMIVSNCIMFIFLIFSQYELFCRALLPPLLFAHFLCTICC